MIPNKPVKLEETTTQLVAAITVSGRKPLKPLGEVQLPYKQKKRYFHVKLLWGKKLYI